MTKLTEASVANDLQIYCDCMARIRGRINVVQSRIKIGLADRTATTPICVGAQAKQIAQRMQG